jgi:hypothetical protein
LWLITEDVQPPDEAKWIRLKKISYIDPSGKPRTWESAERQVSLYPTNFQTPH